MNRYFTEIIIKSADSVGLTKLFDNIFEWSAKMHPEFDFSDKSFGKAHLNNLVLNSGIISNTSEISTTGLILRWSLSNSVLKIHQLTFCGVLCIEIWEILAKAYVPDCEVFFKSIDLDSNNYITNIPDYKDSYVVKTKDSFIEKASAETVEVVLKQRYKGNFDKMMHTYQITSPKSLNISKWNLLSIQETV